MLRLYLAEWKKLWKSKLTLIMILFISGFTIVTNYQNYHQKLEHFSINSDGADWTYQDQNGKAVDSGLDYLKFADQLQDEFKGEINQTLIDRYITYFEDIEASYPRTELDEDYMKLTYGDDYEAFLKKAANGEYTMDQLFQELKNRNLTGSFHDNENSEKYYFTLFYKEDRVLSLYQKAMFGYEEFLSNDPETILDGYYLDGTAASQANAKFCNIKKAEQTSIQESTMISMSDDRDQELLMKLASYHVDNEYGSVVGNNLFAKAMEYINVIVLVVIALLLSNSFSQEVSTKADQIIVCSKYGNTRTTIAKLLCGISLAIGVVLLQYLIIFIMSWMYVPLGNLNLIAHSQADVYVSQVSFYFFTYKEIFGSMIIVQLTAASATACLTMMLSYVTKNRFACVSVIVLFLLGSKFYFLMYPAKVGILTYLNPATMMDRLSFFDLSYSRLPYLKIGSSIIPWRYLTVGIWMIGMGIISMFMYHKSKQHLVHIK